MINNIFSFIKPPIIGLIESSIHIIPGLDKVIALYYDNDEKKLKSKGVYANQDNIITDFIITDSKLSQELRDQKIKYRWMSVNNLPFNTEQIGAKEHNLFDEYNNIVLCIGVNNMYDNKVDLLFLYLNYNKGNFGISNNDKKITTDEKSIIGNIVYNSLDIILTKHISDSKILKLINNKTNKLQEENEKLRKDIQEMHYNHLQTKLDTSISHLAKLSSQYSVNFQLSKDAIDKLKYFTGNIDVLKDILTYSAILALNTNFGQTSNILIRAIDLDFSNNNKEENEITDSFSVNIPDRYKRTLQLLNKLEEATRVVLNENKTPTSENVGGACPTPITAPAISDALKNHQKKIVKLMIDYPSKWSVIRNEFRPVKNILQNQNIG